MNRKSNGYPGIIACPTADKEPRGQGQRRSRSTYARHVLRLINRWRQSCPVHSSLSGKSPAYHGRLYNGVASHLGAKQVSVQAAHIPFLPLPLSLPIPRFSSSKYSPEHTSSTISPRQLPPCIRHRRHRRGATEEIATQSQNTTCTVAILGSRVSQQSRVKATTESGRAKRVNPNKEQMQSDRKARRASGTPTASLGTTWRLEAQHCDGETTFLSRLTIIVSPPVLFIPMSTYVSVIRLWPGLARRTHHRTTASSMVTIYLSLVTIRTNYGNSRCFAYSSPGWVPPSFVPSPSPSPSP